MPTEEVEMTMPIDDGDGKGDLGGEPVIEPEPPTLEDLVNQSGILTNPNLPGINNFKQQKIETYVNGIIQAQGLNIANVQILSKDNGDDIRVTIFNNGAIHTQINYSQIP